MTNVADIAVSKSAVYRFGSPFDGSIGYVPGFYASKSFTGEDASSRYKWRALMFHGEGTLVATVYVDNVMLLDNQVVTMTENVQQYRVINLPRSMSTGYMIRYEYVITSGYVRMVEISYDTVGSDLN